MQNLIEVSWFLKTSSMMLSYSFIFFRSDFHDKFYSTDLKNVTWLLKVSIIFIVTVKKAFLVLKNELFLLLSLTILWSQKLSLLISLLKFCVSFVDWFMASFLYCFPYSYRSSNYCDSNSCRSYSPLKALTRKVTAIFSLLHL